MELFYFYGTSFGAERSLEGAQGAELKFFLKQILRSNLVPKVKSS
jgi:hypothetical protein